ncbi:MAG: hypothetical protein CVT78_12095 [Alphaproteobacteria bacterium HGW-Alphaproteobacteria-17]|nr:MAG: hypothetical protein CVT78_12095 [Alphaproteobacteria bacterium HGW-Alphaproteobacteria-17]
MRGSLLLLPHAESGRQVLEVLFDIRRFVIASRVYLSSIEVAEELAQNLNGISWVSLKRWPIAIVFLDEAQCKLSGLRDQKSSKRRRTFLNALFDPLPVRFLERRVALNEADHIKDSPIFLKTIAFKRAPRNSTFTVESFAMTSLYPFVGVLPGIEDDAAYRLDRSERTRRVPEALLYAVSEIGAVQ